MVFNCFGFEKAIVKKFAVVTSGKGRILPVLCSLGVVLYDPGLLCNFLSETRLFYLIYRYIERFLLFLPVFLGHREESICGVIISWRELSSGITMGNPFSSSLVVMVLTLSSPMRIW